MLKYQALIEGENPFEMCQSAMCVFNRFCPLMNDEEFKTFVNINDSNGHTPAPMPAEAPAEEAPVEAAPAPAPKAAEPEKEEINEATVKALMFELKNKLGSENLARAYEMYAHNAPSFKKIDPADYPALYNGAKEMLKNAAC